MTSELTVDPLVDTPSRRSQVTETLRAAVLAGDMRAGTIYSAPILASQFGVSATPVREAMLDLAKEGLVEVVRNKGFRISEPSNVELANILDLRLLLEVPTIRRIGEQGLKDSQKTDLLKLADATVDAVSRHDYAGHVRADQQFHLSLLGVLGNPELVEVVRVLRSRSRLTGLGLAENQPVLLRSAYEHAALVELVYDRKVDDAEKLMYEHIVAVGRDWSPSH